MSPISSLDRPFSANADTDSNSEAVFYVTDDGTADGEALFDSIDGIQATAKFSVSGSTEGMICTIKSVSGDLKTVVVVVTRGVTLGVLGPTTIYAGSGIKVYLHIHGR